MMSEHPHQLLRDGTAAAVADASGTIILVVSRRTETSHTDGARAVPLTVVAVDGDLDRDTVALLQQALIQALDGGGPVCCDLTRVTFFGAAAADLVFRTHRRASAAGQRLLLRGASPQTRRVMDVVDPQRILARS